MNPLSTLPAPWTIGAWCSKPDASRIATALRLGITELHLMVHDDSADRTSNAWAMDAKIRDYCQRIVDAGIELHLTAWAQPYEHYLKQASDDLVELTLAFGARSICWDAEEPWTQARGKLALPPEQAAQHIDLAGATQGVSGIGYMSHELDPLLAIADYVAPQCYVTGATKGGLELDAVDDLVRRWTARAPKAAMVPALAAYAQIPGGIAAAWRAAFKPRRVLLWSMKHIERRPQLVDQLRAAMQAEFESAPIA